MTYGLKESLPNDLVSRKDVIRHIHKEMDEWLNVDEPGEELAYEVEQIINEVPMVDIKNLLNPDSFDSKKPMTNFDWVTESPERLARWIEGILIESGCEVTQCSEMWIGWLKEKHE